MKEIPSYATSIAKLLSSPPNRSPASSIDSLSAPVIEWTIDEETLMQLRSPRVGSHTPTHPGNDEAGVGSPTTRWAGAAVQRVAPCRNDRRHWAACTSQRARPCTTRGHAGQRQDDVPHGSTYHPTPVNQRSLAPSTHVLYTVAVMHSHARLSFSIILLSLLMARRAILPHVMFTSTDAQLHHITKARPRSRPGGPFPIARGPLGRGT